jgi:hypothetical protein
MFAPKTPVRERILAIGPAGSGKSTAVIDIALKIPESTVHVIDAEPGGAWDRMNPGNEVTNIKVAAAQDWLTFRQSVKDARAQAQVGDWLAVDMLGPTMYDLVQEYYIEKIKGVSSGDFYLDFMDNRGKRKNPLEGDTDWMAIKKMYAEVLSDMLNFPGHVIALAGVKPPPRDDYDTKENRELFGAYGVRPEGEKKTAHAFSTILYFAQKRGSWTFTTVRERNPRVGMKREYVEGKVWEDFGRSYLWEVAGWRPGR